jgi:hypothetical protein
MQMKIDLAITAPEIADAILILAKAITMVQLKAEALEGGENVLKAKDSAAADGTGSVQGNDEVKITLDELREVLIAFSRDGKQEQVKDLITRYGGKKLTDIPEEKYMDMFKEVEKW